MEFSEKIPGLRLESNPHLHNSGVMLYHLQSQSVPCPARTVYYNKSLQVYPYFIVTV